MREQEWNPLKYILQTCVRCRARTCSRNSSLLILKAGIGQIDFQDKYAAIKIHFGEPGNLSYLLPNFAKTVADAVKELGCPPVSDRLQHAVVSKMRWTISKRLMKNGFSPFSTGCQIIIADGLKGTDEVDVPVRGGEYIREAHIGRAVMDADIFISLLHFKGHESTGFGGAINKYRHGCGFAVGKMDMHCAGKPDVDKSVCRGLRGTKNCAHGAIAVDENRKRVLTTANVWAAARCIGACTFYAVDNGNDSANDELNCKMAEYAKAVVDGRPAFHINIVNQVSPYCDCHGENDTAIIPDVGDVRQL